MIANIGGRAAYPNVLEKLYDLNVTGQLPDICCILECGNDSDSTSLEPYFNSYQSNEYIRIHTSNECPETKITFNNKACIAHLTVEITIKSETQTINIIIGYRNFDTSKTTFFYELINILYSIPQKQPVWLGGDFNTYNDDDEIIDLIDKFNLIELSNATHIHRKGDTARQIDYLLTNSTAIKATVEIHHSLENKAKLDKSLGHQCFVLAINKTRTKKYKQVTRTDCPTVFNYFDGKIKHSNHTISTFHNSFKLIKLYDK